MSLKTLLHLDSIDGIQNYDPILKIYHCYNTNILINKPISNIKEISLKSLEMPLFFNNIRTANNSNTIHLVVYYYDPLEGYIVVNYPIIVTLTEAIYNNINALLTAINTKINTSIATYDGLTASFSVSNNNYITLTTNAYKIQIFQSILINNILGFTTGIFNSSIITTTNFYCLNIDNYINLYITNLNSGSDTNANGRLLTFKIQLNAVNGQILYLGESNSFTQTISITDPYYVLTSLNIMILDRFGFPINGGNAYFSFTLGITYDKPIDQVKLKRIF